MSAYANSSKPMLEPDVAQQRPVTWSRRTSRCRSNSRPTRFLFFPEKTKFFNLHQVFRGRIKKFQDAPKVVDVASRRRPAASCSPRGRGLSRGPVDKGKDFQLRIWPYSCPESCLIRRNIELFRKCCNFMVCWMLKPAVYTMKNIFHCTSEVI